MEKKPLDESLERLHSELKQTEAKDEESRRLLLDLQEDTRSAIKHPSPAAHASLRARLEQAVDHFEDSHPQLTVAMPPVLDHLANV